MASARLAVLCAQQRQRLDIPMCMGEVPRLWRAIVALIVKSLLIHE